MSAPTSPITRRQEIALVAGRELRAHLMKKSTIILTLVLLVAVIGGIIGISIYTSGQDKAYRLGLKGTPVSQATGLGSVVASNGETIEVVEGEGYGKLLPPKAEDGNSLLRQWPLRGSRLHRRPKEASRQVDQHDLAALEQDRLHGDHVIVAHKDGHEAGAGDALGKRPEACKQVVQEGQLVRLAHALDSRKDQRREDEKVYVTLGRYLRVGQHTLAGPIEVTRSAVYLCNANSH